MNPRTDYNEADTTTARAFVELFIRHDDAFQFGIDAQTPPDEELRAWLSVTNHKDTDGRSTLGITGINQPESFSNVAETIRAMGLTVVDEMDDMQHSEDIGEYRAERLLAYAEDGVDADWNRPMLLVYGSLSPEVEEACYAAFGRQFEYHNVRNHFVVAGEGLTADHRARLSDAVSQSTEFFEEDKRRVRSSIRTGDLL